MIALIGVLIFWSGTAGRGQSPASNTTQAAPSAAATPASAADTTVLHAVTNLVLVDVVVTDRDKTVHGLDRSRFHIFEDGREQAVTSFDEHQLTAPRIAALNLPKLPPNTFSNTPAYPETGTVNVLLLDALNTPAASQMDVRNQMVDYLARIEPGTTLAIFTLSSQLRLAAGFTTDAAQLVKVLQSSKGATPSVVLDSAPNSVSAAPDEMAMMGAPDGAASSPQIQQFIASMQQFSADIASFQTDMRVRMTLDALQDLARYLNAVPGRKNLIWFSGSFPIALDPNDTLSSPFQAMRSYSDDIRETAQLLSAARVAVYPVDARGLMSLKLTSAAYTPSSTPATGNPKRGAGFGNDDTIFMKTTTDEHSSMEQIAEETGGKAYFDTNGLKEAVAKAIDNGSSYYTIGYVPVADKLDGRFHKIQVRLDNGGYKLAYRQGYYADDPGKSSSHDPGKPNIVAQAALPGAPPATQILFQARVLLASDPLLSRVNLPSGPAGALAATLKGPVTRYVIELHVDPHGIAFQDTADGAHKADMEFAVIAYDTDEKRVNYFDRSVELNLKPDQYARLMAGKIPALVALDLPAGKIALRIVIVDQAGGRAGSLEVPVAIPAR
jgi:VWFA-related protein